MNNKVNTNTDANAATSAQTAANTAAAGKHFKPFEVIGGNDESKTKTVIFNIPLTFRVSSNAPDEKICKFIVERARLNIGQSAKFINYLSEVMLMREYNNFLFVQETAAFFMQLADETEGYCEVIEMIEMFESRLASMDKEKAAAAANKRQTAKQNADAARDAVARWLYRKPTRELIRHSLPEFFAAATPERIADILKEQGELSKKTGEPSTYGWQIVKVLSPLACDRTKSDDRMSELLTGVTDEILNPGGE